MNPQRLISFGDYEYFKEVVESGGGVWKISDEVDVPLWSWPLLRNPKLSRDEIEISQGSMSRRIKPYSYADLEAIVKEEEMP